MRRIYLALAAAIGLVALLVLPAVAFGQQTDPSKAIDKLSGGLDETQISLNTMWVIVAACLVMFMQAGFAFLEVGFSRMKNAGAGIAKILVNFSIASIAYWAVGFALAFGGAGAIAGDSGFFLDVGSTAGQAAKQFPILDVAPISPAALLFFQFVLDLRRRLASGQHRHAGLRRLHGGPPDRCDRRARRAAPARPA